MLTLRRILFVLFLVIYLVCCPLIVLHALGINLNPRSGPNLTKTGIISLSTLPTGATIYLDNLRYPEKTATVIRNLVPGEYSLKVVLKGHRLWGKILPVKAETATVLENVLLVPQKWETQPLSYLSFEELIPVHHDSFFLLTRGPLLKDIFIFRISGKLSEQILPALEGTDRKPFVTPLFPKDTIYSDAKMISYVTIPGSTSLFLQVNLKGDEKFLWIDLKQRPLLIDDITDLIMKKPKKIIWERQDNKNIFIYQDEAITRLETVTKAIYPKIAEHLLGWGLHNQRLYTLSPKRMLRKASYDGKEEELLLQGRSLNLAHLDENTEYQIHVLTDNLFLFHGENGELLTNQTPLPLVEKGVKNFDFDEPSGRLLFWTEHKLGVIDLSFAEEGIALGPRLVWLIQEARNIEQAFWVNNASYVLYRDQDKIFLGETEKFNVPDSWKILNVKHNSAVVYSEITGQLYYLDAQTHQLLALTVVPVTDRFTFPKSKSKEELEP